LSWILQHAFSRHRHVGSIRLLTKPGRSYEMAQTRRFGRAHACAPENLIFADRRI
jgi:hypothetical protein